MPAHANSTKAGVLRDITALGPSGSYWVDAREWKWIRDNLDWNEFTAEVRGRFTKISRVDLQGSLW